MTGYTVTTVEGEEPYPDANRIAFHEHGLKLFEDSDELDEVAELTGFHPYENLIGVQPTDD